jgi:hypothetical protein
VINIRSQKDLFTIFLILGVIGLFLLVNIKDISALPQGGTLGTPTQERRPTDPAGSDNAGAGNVTEMSITGTTITRTWQGYYGNVSGVITLDDANNYTMYNWTVANPEGEVYAANQSVTWTNIQCFNMTANGTLVGDDIDARSGATSLAGWNMTHVENMTGILWDDVDGLNETFTLLGSGHDLFYTDDEEFSVGECPNTRIYGDTGAGVDNEFEEVLLWDPTNYVLVFATILDNDLLGFDNAYHDYEMIVLENGHGTDVDTTTYYFWVELA